MRKRSLIKMQFDDESLQMDVLAEMLKSDQRESADLVELLATLLESSLPDKTKVTRGGWFMAKKHPVEELTIQFNDVGYVIIKNKHGAVSVRQQKIVRGVTLKSSDVTMEQCISDIVQQLTELSNKNSEMRRALSKFMTGGGL